MKFSLPGQFRGPECRSVSKVAIKIRNELNELCKDVKEDNISELIVILRIDGSLGSFGKPGVDNFANNVGVVECDLVITAQKWGELSDEKIESILLPKVKDAFKECVNKYATNPEELKKILSKISS
jgi:hypothetical protein